MIWNWESIWGKHNGACPKYFKIVMQLYPVSNTAYTYLKDRMCVENPVPIRYSLHWLQEPAFFAKADRAVRLYRRDLMQL